MDLVWLITECDIHRPCISIGHVIIVQLQPNFLIMILCVPFQCKAHESTDYWCLGLLVEG